MATRQSLSHKKDCFVPRNDVGEKMAPNPKHYDIGVVGAGPAGILAAIYAAKAGKSVVLLEKNDAIGRKILATGNGRCNISNTNITVDRYHGTNVSFAEPILADFDVVNFFESLGVLLKEEDCGRLFPRTDQAVTVVDALKAELDKLGVEICTGFTVKHITSPYLSSQTNSSVIPATSLAESRREAGIQRKKELDSWPPTRNDNYFWQIASENGDTIAANKLLLTTGGKAAHQFGSGGDGLFWARNWGHNIVPIHAALVPLEAKETWVKDIMGIRLVAKTILIIDGKATTNRTGDILFTHYGVSGPAAMGLASGASQALAGGSSVVLSIDMMPEADEQSLSDKLMGQLAADGKKSIKNVLSNFLPKNLVPHILASSRINPETKAAELSKSGRQAIVGTIKDFRLTISKVRPLKEAQVTAGGIDTSEITTNLESKIVPGLYFAGEILDIDGDSGGFNLQWAWASGKRAGTSAAGETV